MEYISHAPRFRQAFGRMSRPNKHYHAYNDEHNEYTPPAHRISHKASDRWRKGRGNTVHSAYDRHYFGKVAPGVVVGRYGVGQNHCAATANALEQTAKVYRR